MRDPLFIEAACDLCNQRIFHSAIENRLYCTCEAGPTERSQDYHEIRAGVGYRRRAHLYRDVI